MTHHDLPRRVWRAFNEGATRPFELRVINRAPGTEHVCHPSKCQTCPNGTVCREIGDDLLDGLD